MEKRLTLNVQGMTCSSCEVLIERKLRKVPGVEHVRVNRAREEARIESSGDVRLADLQQALAGEKYTLTLKDGSSSPGKGFILNDKERWAEVGSILVILLGAYILLKQLDLLPKGLGITDNMSYGFIFLVGLVAAASTCLAVAGGLLLAITNKWNEQYPNLTGRQKFQPHLYFNIGRIVSYTFFGGLLGLAGSVFAFSSKVNGVIMIIASVLMIIMGLQLLQIFPWLNRFQFKMPKFLAHKVYDASSSAGTMPKKSSAFLFGGATFFLPCGFTQALQLYVLGKGDFATGALTMLAFSLGTLPALLSVGALSSFLKGKFHRNFTTFSAVLVILLGVFNIPNGLSLTGASISLGDDTSFPLAEQVNIIGGKQVISMKVDYLDYVPAQFTIVEGIPVEWHIDGTTAVGCAQVISVPSLGITEYLPKNQEKVITFTPPPGTTNIRFSCSMGMAGPGVFTVVPNTQGIKPAQAEGVNLAAVESGDVQKLSMEISRERGFYPNSFTVKKGIPVELDIDTTIPLSGCMGTMVIPKYGVAHLLSLGKTTLRFTPTEEGTVPFTCSMGSRIGEFKVI